MAGKYYVFVDGVFKSFKQGLVGAATEARERAVASPGQLASVELVPDASRGPEEARYKQVGRKLTAWVR